MSLEEQLLGDVPPNQVPLGTALRSVAVSGLELGVGGVESLAPNLVGLVNRGELPAQPNPRQGGLTVNAAAQRFVDMSPGIGVQTLPEKSLHLGLAHLTIDTHGRQAGADPATRRVALRGVVVAQRLSATALVVAGGYLTCEVGVPVPSMENVHGHHSEPPPSVTTVRVNPVKMMT